MRRCAAPALLLPLLLLTACVPERDNSYDPTRSPAAVLDILDRTSFSGECLAVSSSSAWPAISEGSRGLCLALSGWRTIDPQGTLPSDLRYTFEQVADDGTVLTTFATEAPEPLVALPERLLGSLPGGSIARFHLTVRDESGAVGFASAQLVIRNSAPIAFTQDSRTIPLHGFPWATLEDAPAPIPFEGRAFDADGDGNLLFEWLDETGTIVATGSNAVLSVATDRPVRRVFRLRVGDGDLVSEPEPVSLYVGSPNIWAARHATATTDPFSVAILRPDSSFRRPGNVGPYSLSDVLAIDVEPSGAFVAFLTLTDVIIATWPDLELITAAPIPTTPGQFDQPVMLRAASNGIWVVGSYLDTFSALGVGVIRFDYSNGTLAFAGGPVSIEPDLTGNMTGHDAMAAIDETGSVWSAGRFGTRLRAIDPVTLTTSHGMDLPAQVWTGIAREPDGPMWAVTGRQIAGGNVGVADAVRFVPEAGGYRADVFPLGSSAAAGLAWIDGGYFWTFLAEYGACLIDAALLEVAADPADARALCIESSETLVEVAADPVSGTAWWLSFLGSTGAVSNPDGELNLFFSDTFRQVNSVDPAGSAWFVEIIADDVDTGRVAHGRTHETSNLFVSHPVSFGDATADGFGGAWIGTLQPAFLRRLSEDGNVIDTISELDLGGTIASVPLVGGLDYDDAGGLWIMGLESQGLGGSAGSSVYRVDVLAPRTVPFRAPAERITTPAGFPLDGEVIGASGPRSSVKHLWFRRAALFGGTTLRHVSQGVETSLMSLSGEDDWFGAASPAGASFCYGHEMSAEIRLHRSEGGPPPTLTLTTSWTISGGILKGVGASSRAGTAAEDWCWMAIGNAVGSPSLRVYAYDSAGNRVRTYEDDLGDIISFTVVSADEMWVLREGTPPSPQFLEFKGAGANIEGSLAPLDAHRFVDR